MKNGAQLTKGEKSVKSIHFRSAYLEMCRVKQKISLLKTMMNDNSSSQKSLFSWANLAFENSAS